MSYLIFMCAFGVMPLVRMIDPKHLSNIEDCAFIVFYFTIVGIAVVNPFQEPKSINLWMMVFCYTFFAISGLYLAHEKAKKDN